jgi:hypothetical protein
MGLKSLRKKAEFWPLWEIKLSRAEAQPFF